MSLATFCYWRNDYVICTCTLQYATSIFIITITICINIVDVQYVGYGLTRTGERMALQSFGAWTEHTRRALPTAWADNRADENEQASNGYWLWNGI